MAGSGYAHHSVGLTPRPGSGRGAVIKSRVVVESRQAALEPPPSGANDLVVPLRDGTICVEHIQCGDRNTGGTRPGRTSAAQITLYSRRHRGAGRGGAQLVYDAAKQRA